ncbi:enoyl-CoA hydratase-related protein [Pseudomonas silvicola]|nr:enoyl-CoA hydratase-related protein [Pseudomonas silvicola]
MGEPIRYEQQNGIAVLTLDRPEKLNALTNAMYLQLAERLRQINADAHIKTVIVRGSEQCFTAGNDLHDFVQAPPTHQSSPAFTFMHAVIELDKPLIAAVCGPAIGIGTTLLLHCDHVVTTHDAKLRTPFVKLGLTPEFGSSLLLPQLLGHARAAHLLVLGETISGAQALEWGLASECVITGQACINAAMTHAQRLIELPDQAARLTRRMMRKQILAELRAVIEEENEVFIAQLASPHTQSLLAEVLNRSAHR